MDCNEAQQRLLEADDRSVELTSPPLAEHLSVCAECRRLAADLDQLEAAWRAVPLPASCDAARQAFLAHLTPAPAPRVARRVWLRRVAIGTAAAVVAGAGSWLWFDGSSAEADEVLDSLVDWNVRLTQAPSPDARRRLYREQRGALEARASKAGLRGEPSLLANALLENGQWLAAHADPLDEAARFNDLADRLMHAARDASRAGKARRAHRLWSQYDRMVEGGFGYNLLRAENVAADKPKKQRIDRLRAQSNARLDDLASLAADTPAPTDQQLQQLVKKHRKYAKKGGRAASPSELPLD